MKEKKTIILAVVLLLLVGVYIYYNQKIAKETKPTGKAVDIARVAPNFELKAKVSKAIRKYIQENGDAPRSFDKLQGKYLDQASYNLALSKNIEYKYLGQKSYRMRLTPKRGPIKVAKGPGTQQKPGATTSAAGSASGAPSSKLATTETGWKYDPTGKPDPFKSFILASAAQEETAPMVVRRQLTPLQKMPLSEIEAGLKAIIWGQLGNKALVEDATGKGYVVQEGTYVGQHDGIVKKIYEDRIIVEEYRRDPGKDRLEPNEVVLKLKKVEAEE
ncbi:MAG: pilus assembly protein PilP [Deltaproteobacteria bacterium]|nr:MAG: pilus assembly protein PilP [Deltaproteobacteria bacterium]